jgi:sugar/nucleoside kinase (ribokinase family)
MTTPYDLVCLGNLSIDDVVLPDKTTRPGCFGGDVTYAALGAGFWSDSVRCVAPMGEDFPAEHLSYLNQFGWDTRGFPKRPIPCLHYRVEYEDNNQRTWYTVSPEGDFPELSPKFADIPVDYLQARAFLLLAMDLAAHEALVAELSRYGLVALDPQEEYIPGNETRVLAMLDKVDIFLPSHEEVFRLFKHHDYEKACHQLADCGPKIVVVKLGDKGSLVFDSQQDRFWRIPVIDTTVVDTTGAGDTYSGGFMAMYMRSADLVTSGLAGTVSASFAIQDFGLSHMFGIPRADAERRLTELGNRLSLERD